MPLPPPADQPPFECTLANSNASVCQCTPTYIRIPPWMCAAGDADNAREKMVAQVCGCYWYASVGKENMAAQVCSVDATAAAAATLLYRWQWRNGGLLPAALLAL